MAIARPPTWKYVLFGLIIGGGWLGFGIFVITRAVIEMGSRESTLTNLCLSRLSVVAKAQLLYAADNNDTLPMAGHWVDATWTYGEEKGPKGKKIDPAEMNESVFKCPAVSAMRAGGYGYGFNKLLDRKRIVEGAGDTPLVFDCKSTDRNAVCSAGTDYPGRHDDGRTNVVAMLDGRVRAEPVK